MPGARRAINDIAFTKKLQRQHFIHEVVILGMGESGLGPSMNPSLGVFARAMHACMPVCTQWGSIMTQPNACEVKKPVRLPPSSLVCH